MHAAEAEAYCSDAGQDAAYHGQHSQPQQARRAIDGEQEHDHEQGAEQCETMDVALDALARGHGEHGGAAHLQMGVGSAIRDGVEGLADGGQAACLGIGVRAFGAGLQQQQGTATVGRGPHAFAMFGLAVAGELLQQAQGFAGGVARQQLLEQQAAVARKLVQGAADGFAEPGR